MLKVNQYGVAELTKGFYKAEGKNYQALKAGPKLNSGC